MQNRWRTQLQDKLDSPLTWPNMSTEPRRAEAIAIAELHITSGGFKHGLCIDCHPIGTAESDYWEVEFAHYGQTGRSETCDPPSTRYRVNVKTNEVLCFDLM